MLRGLGDLGVLRAVDAVLLVTRPPMTNQQVYWQASERASHRGAHRDAAFEVVHRFNPEAVVVVGVPFGHTRPQWIVPYGGRVTIDSGSRRIWPSYD